MLLYVDADVKACPVSRRPLVSLRRAPLRWAFLLSLRQERQREKTRCDNRVLLFIQELSPLARWLARLMSPYSMSAEASSPLDVHTGVTAGIRPVCWEYSTGTRIKTEETFPSLCLSLFFLNNSDTIIRGIWVWVKVRKEVLFVVRIERKKKNRMQRHILTPRLFKNYLIRSAKVSAVI